ncbi:polysaccharide biosynthesis C-terminal domain-containing protein [Marnyiella aurantia]|uniref:Polysaccharide biosynthesis C-terminal domain-containing protein n=1 Tax=Marnyiella aurantia TaxID=2758037 RepID=A0A7D7LQK6_9FLAO|nr:polysaccharide biosynthesis C-terminal domain-containing protein [Marnyiella aurantia]MBA5246899.1 polysaccharide biosynthesis C-terminal domain-containing protein [Marnyiella aurantia]QMS97758.1 polysaccharide biosynthesis C-terminal domain-containing protein [Marnyiella aurantia]
MQKTFIHTFLSRALILILNFGIIIFATNVWGSQGKGSISMLIADLAIIGFISNIFVGSITYLTSRYKTADILGIAYVWSVVVGISIPLVVHFAIRPVYDLRYLVLLSVLFSLLTSNINHFIGKQDIAKFNLYTILQQGVHLVFILAAFYIFGITSLNTYFITLIACYGVLFFVSTLQLSTESKLPEFSFSGAVIRSMFSYGWKTQLSALMQFMNYRLSFYFLEVYRGIASVGVFSIGVALSEGIWAVSRSLSTILYSKVVNSSNQLESVDAAKVAIKLSFLVTSFFVLIILCVPAEVYTIVFGEAFYQTKLIFMLLSPGILAIAVSNIVGSYFAGVNRLQVLNIKSFVGLAFTVISSVYVIPRWGIIGACVVTTISYCLSSGILFWKFYKGTTFKVADLLPTKAELTFVKQFFSTGNK